MYRISEVLQCHNVVLIRDWYHDKERRSGAGVGKGLVVSNGDHKAYCMQGHFNVLLWDPRVSRRLVARRFAKGLEYLFEPF